jgi:ribosomal protein S18 acetylase RimI-like enzyme
MDLTIRSASARDIDSVIAILLEEPPPDVGALARDASTARSVGVVLARHGMLIGIEETVIAVGDGHPVGLMETLRSGSEQTTGLREAARIILGCTRLAGPGVFFRYSRLMRARARMDIRCPAGEFDLNELDVHVGYRNRGIGGQLLTYAEELAKGSGFFSICLTTETNNRARSLYQRAGFEVVREARDPIYERLTGAPGRVLLRKEL